MPAITLGTLAVSIVAGEGVWVALLACVFVAGIYGGLVLPVRYTLDEAHLMVRFGLVRQRILYDRIRRVRPTRNPLSSPALSLDRLRVEYGSGVLSFVMFSPTPRDEFQQSSRDAPASCSRTNRSSGSICHWIIGLELR